jgi:hypothetical protein
VTNFDRPAPAVSANAEAEQKAATSSLGDLLGDVSRDISTLFRQEVDLAKAELTESAKRAGKGAGFLTGAGVTGHLAVVFLSLTVMFLLGWLFDRNVPAGLIWAALIVTVIWAIVAAILAATGRKDLKEVQGAPRTVESVKKIPEALK